MLQPLIRKTAEKRLKLVYDALRGVSDLGENETVNGAQQHACT